MCNEEVSHPHTKNNKNTAHTCTDKLVSHNTCDKLSDKKTAGANWRRDAAYAEELRQMVFLAS